MADMIDVAVPDVPAFALGLGCDRGTPLATVQTALQLALQHIQADVAQISVLATINAKSDEIALLELARLMGLDLLFYSADQLAAVPVANPSATVLRYMGTPSVSEAAALLAAAYRPETAQPELVPTKPAPVLVLEKFKYKGVCGKNATISIAEIFT